MCQGADICLLGIPTLWASCEHRGKKEEANFYSPHAFFCAREASLPSERGLKDQKAGLGFALGSRLSLSFLFRKMSCSLCPSLTLENSVMGQRVPSSGPHMLLRRGREGLARCLIPGFLVCSFCSRAGAGLQREGADADAGGRYSGHLEHWRARYSGWDGMTPKLGILGPVICPEYVGDRLRNARGSPQATKRVSTSFLGNASLTEVLAVLQSLSSFMLSCATCLCFLFTRCCTRLCIWRLAGRGCWLLRTLAG